MEKMTINFAGRKVVLRVYDYEREAMRKAAQRLGVTLAQAA
jgi:hypothetical protein